MLPKCLKSGYAESRALNVLRFKKTPKNTNPRRFNKHSQMSQREDVKSSGKAAFVFTRGSLEMLGVHGNNL